MSTPAWLALVLDRVLPDINGGERDRIAAAIVDALPLETVQLAITERAVIELFGTTALGCEALETLGVKLGKAALAALASDPDPADIEAA